MTENKLPPYDESIEASAGGIERENMTIFTIIELMILIGLFCILILIVVFGLDSQVSI